MGTPREIIFQRSLGFVQDLSTKDFGANFQWLARLVGVKGNEAAGQMARNALSFAPTVKVAHGRRIGFRRAIINDLKSRRGHLHPCVTKGLTTADATLL